MTACRMTFVTFILAGIASAILIAGAPRESIGANIPADRELYFTATRDGSPFGFHRARFTENGDELIVETDIELKVNLGFITFFRYRHTNREVWYGGQLIQLDSQTYDNGNEISLRLRESENGTLMVENNSGEVIEAPAGIIPTSYWNKAITEQDLILNTQNGELLEVTVTPMGTEEITARGEIIEASRYLLSGSLDLELWYDADGTWVKSRFDARGASVVYELTDEAAG